MTLLSVVESNSIRFYIDDLTTIVPNILGWNYMRAGTSNGTAWWYDDQPLRVGTVQWHNSGSYNLNGYLARAYLRFDIPVVGVIANAKLLLEFPVADPSMKVYLVALGGKPSTGTSPWTTQWIGRQILGAADITDTVVEIPFSSEGIAYLNGVGADTIYIGVILQADYNDAYYPTSESMKLSDFTTSGLEINYRGVSAEFSGTPTSGGSGTTVTFTDESIAFITTISSWEWDFGDGSGSSLQNPTHVFTNPGFYIIQLTVRSPDGYTDSVVKWKYITVTGDPIGVELDPIKSVGDGRSRGGVVLMPGLTESPIDHNQLILNDTLLTVLLKALKTNTLSERARGGVVRMIGMIMATKTGGAFPYGSYPHSFHIGSVDFGVNIETKFIESSFIGRMLNSNDRFRTYDDSWYWIEKFHYDNCLITDSELREGICWREIDDNITLEDLDLITVFRLYIADYIIRVGEDNKYGQSVENPNLRGEYDREGLNGD